MTNYIKSFPVNATPLIVVGPQRSGTRFITNVLNRVPEVTLHGEIPDGLFNGIRAATLGQKEYGDSKPPREMGMWQHNRAMFLFAAWTFLSKSQTQENTACRYFGYKSPYHEQYFDFYRTAFAPLEPRFICCVRSFEQHVLSVQARWPRRPIAYIALRYWLSLRQIRHMLQVAPSHVCLFVLDDYQKNGLDYLVARVFRPLGLEDIQAALKLAKSGPANSSAQHGVVKKAGLNLAQRLFLRLLPWPKREFEAVRRVGLLSPSPDQHS